MINTLRSFCNYFRIRIVLLLQLLAFGNSYMLAETTAEMPVVGAAETVSLMGVTAAEKPAVGNTETDSLIGVEASTFFNNTRFDFFSDKLSLRIPLKINVENYIGVILAIESSDGSFLNLALETEQNREKQLLLYTKQQIYTYPVFPHRNSVSSPFGTSTDSTILSLAIDFKKNILNLKINEEPIVVKGLGLTVNNGYKFHLLPNRPLMVNGREVIVAGTPAVQITSVTTPRYPTWFWYIIILCADLLIFLVVHRRRKNKKQKTTVPSLSQESGKIPQKESAVEFPQKSAIYLFGGMRIYDRNGEDIAKQFSPLLKELLSLLVITSNQQGISSEKLKDILWSDKSEASARNNRAVNFGKLRSLLSLVGDYELERTNGYWNLSLRGIFSDYHEYETLVATPELDRQQIRSLLALISEGVILKNSGYHWLDKYKSRISDQVIEVLSRYANTPEPEKDVQLTERIADAMFLYDSVNEYALHLKCFLYVHTGNAYMAKSFFCKFSKEYQLLYGENYPYTLEDVLERKFL